MLRLLLDLAIMVPTPLQVYNIRHYLTRTLLHSPKSFRVKIVHHYLLSIYFVPFSWRGKGTSTQCRLLGHYSSYITLAITRRFSCFMRQLWRHSVPGLRTLPLEILTYVEDDVLGGTIYSFPPSRHGSNGRFQRLN